MKTVTQNSMLCYTYNTKRCKSFEQNVRQIQNLTYIKKNLFQFNLFNINM